MSIAKSKLPRPPPSQYTLHTTRVEGDIEDSVADLNLSKHQQSNSKKPGNLFGELNTWLYVMLFHVML